MDALGARSLVGRYLGLGLALGRHIDGLVDAYYGPKDLADRADAEPLADPRKLASEARSILRGLDDGEPLDSQGAPVDSADVTRRRWLGSQVKGLSTTARRLAGERISYADEVEACYGVRPRRVPEDRIERAHHSLDDALPGQGRLWERYTTWREAHAAPVDLLESAIASLSEDLRERTDRLFGLPEGEHVDFELVTSKPWSGFNYYLGNLTSRVAINVDLPVLTTSLAHLVAHEAYPGHHTEHTRKEVGLVRKRRYWEESIFLVGTPQCLLAEGLADLGLEITMGRRPEMAIAEHLGPLGLRYDAETIAQVAEAGETLGAVRANAAFRLHEDGAPPEQVVTEISRWGLLPRPRAEKAVEFLSDPTWRTYITCYVEGLALCRSFVSGRPERFARLVTEQLVPSDLAA